MPGIGRGETGVQAWRRVAPFILAGLLLTNLAIAIADGGRENWLMVALVAAILALLLVRHARPTRP